MIEADRVAALGFPRAIAALRDALAGGLDPESEPARMPVPLGGGEILVMPSGDERIAGIKLVGVAPGNPARGLARIHGVYVLFDAPTLAPRAVLDGAALTSLRTPAVSALGVDLVAPADARALVVFGTGPQALGHIEAIRAVRPITSVRVVGRDAEKTAAFVRNVNRAGGASTESPAVKAAGRESLAAEAAGRESLAVEAASRGSLAVEAASRGSLAVEAAGPEAVADADIVACCTSAREPLFDGALLRDDAVVVAVGSHEPDAREVDTETVRRCGALVEARSVALREAGDLIQAGAQAHDLVTFSELVRGTSRARPRLIKTVGMGWEDLVIAAAVVESLS